MAKKKKQYHPDNISPTFSDPAAALRYGLENLAGGVTEFGAEPPTRSEFKRDTGIDTYREMVRSAFSGMSDYQIDEAEKILKELAARDIEGLRLDEPLPLQAAFHNCRARERLLRGGNQCLAGEQTIFDPVANAHRRIEEIDGPFHVVTVNEQTGERSVGEATKPFVKGQDDL